MKYRGDHNTPDRGVRSGGSPRARDANAARLAALASPSAGRAPSFDRYAPSASATWATILASWRPPPRGPVRSTWPSAAAVARSSAAQPASMIAASRLASLGSIGRSSASGAIPGAPKSVVALPAPRQLGGCRDRRAPRTRVCAGRGPSRTSGRTRRAPRALPPPYGRSGTSPATRSRPRRRVSLPVR